MGTRRHLLQGAVRTDPSHCSSYSLKGVAQHWNGQQRPLKKWDCFSSITHIVVYVYSSRKGYTWLNHGKIKSDHPSRIHLTHGWRTLRVCLSIVAALSSQPLQGELKSMKSACPYGYYENPEKEHYFEPAASPWVSHTIVGPREGFLDPWFCHRYAFDFGTNYRWYIFF